MSETEKFEQWFADQKKNHGLVDVKFTLGDTRGSTVESVFAEVNAFIAAPRYPITDPRF